MKRPSDSTITILKKLQPELLKEARKLKLAREEYRPSTLLRKYGFTGTPHEIHNKLTTCLIMWNKEIREENEIFQEEIDAKIIEDGLETIHETGLAGISEKDFENIPKSNDNIKLDPFGFPVK